MLTRVLATAVAASYGYLKSRRVLLLLGVAALLALFALVFMAIPIREDVSALLPDGKGAAGEEFRLLQDAPFTRKLVIHLKIAEGGSQGDLLAGADALSSRLVPPLFTRVVSGPDESAGPRLMPLLVAALPSLTDDKDLAEIERRLLPEEIAKRIKGDYYSLIAPEGWVLKDIIRKDPLGFRDLAFAKMRFVNVLGDVNMTGGRFMSKDGRSLLLFAETPVGVADSEGAEKLVNAFDEAARAAAPKGVEVSLIGAQRYTLANAQTIKRDLNVILAVASGTILLLLLFCLRGWGGLWVFLMPTGGMLGAAAVTGLILGKLNGVTLGFGGVLLGISVDYGIYVFYALRSRSRPPGEMLGMISGPVLFAALTTIGSFAALFTSDLPGQRELALFSIAGVVICLGASLFLLPHSIKSGREEASAAPRAVCFDPKPRPWMLLVWGFAVLFLAWEGLGVRFAGDMQKLGVVSPELKAAEKSLQESWGDMKGRAMFFCRGQSGEEALLRSGRLLDDLRAGLPGAQIQSLSAILKSSGQGGDNLARWKTFWTRERIEALRAGMDKAALPLGFAPDAFEPFFTSLASPAGALTADELREAGLGDLLDALMITKDGKTTLVTLAPDDDAVKSFWAANAAKHQGTVLVSPSSLSKSLGGSIKADFVKFLILSTIAVVVLAVWLLRVPRRVAGALAPMVAGFAALFGSAALMGVEFDLFNIVGTVLIAGMSVDYGIYVACRYEEAPDMRIDWAVLLCGISTLAGIGSLALARHPALSSIGSTVLVGITASMITALWITPLIAGGKRC